MSTAGIFLIWYHNTIFVINMRNYSLSEIVEKYEGYTKRRVWYFYLVIALILLSWFINPVLPTVIFLVYFLTFSIGRVYTNIRFYKWVYKHNIDPAQLTHSFKTKKLVEGTYAINSCIWWAMPGDKPLLRSLKAQIEESLWATSIFNEEAHPEADYIIYRKAWSWLRVVLVFSGFCLIISYINAGYKYLLHILAIGILLLIPASIFYLRRKKTPYMIISEDGIRVKKEVLIRWKEISELHIDEESDGEDTSYILKIHLHNGDVRNVDMNDVTADLGVLEIHMKKIMQHIKKRR